MKYLGYLLFSISLVGLSCTKDFEMINTDPNAPNEVQPGLLLRQVIYTFGEEMSYEGFVAGNLLGQYFTMVDFNLFDRHSLRDPQLGGNPWPAIYTNLRDNEIILELSQNNESFAIYEAPALILKAYMTAVLTDIYGDVPYSEALRGHLGLTTPAYEAQEIIYTAKDGILDLLDQAIAAIENYSGAIPLHGDILLDGDLNGWKTFAHSLKIKYLLRISDRLDVAGQLQSIYDSGDYMKENTQNATFDFTDGRPNSFRMQQLRDGDFKLFILSETMEEILKSLNDPRIAVFFRPTENNKDLYAGLLNGPDASQTSISVADFSLAGTIFRERTGDLDANFLTAWETQFLLAEAAERQLIGADASMHYEKAIALAFQYWHTELPESYLMEIAAYGQNGADKIEQILTQKWIANILNGYEGWIEYRRTGFPVLKPVSASLNNDRIPVRMPYPADEAALNESNYNKATRENDNSVNAKVWWDVD